MAGNEGRARRPGISGMDQPDLARPADPRTTAKARYRGPDLKLHRRLGTQTGAGSRKTIRLAKSCRVRADFERRDRSWHPRRRAVCPRRGSGLPDDGLLVDDALVALRD